MSAMPERVLAYVSVFGTYSQIKDEYHDVECILVPESRLLAAEARVREVEAERDAIGGEVGAGLYSGALHLLICNGDHNLPLWDVKPGVLCNCPIGKHFKELHRENATLRADLDALVPLARVGLFLRDKLLAGVTNTDLREHLVWCLEEWVVAIDGEDTPRTTQARAILAREAGE